MILAILQARMSSSRLPGKVLMPILGRPMLSLQIERALHSRRVDQLIVATSTEKGDDKIESLCNDMNVSCFRGSLNDVLDRFYQAALLHKPEHVVRLTGDCPLVDPVLIDQMITSHVQGDYDITTNAGEDPTFPDGLDAEIISFDILRQAWKEADLLSEREHVTPYIYKNNVRYKINYFRNTTNLSKLRWTVDEEEDFDLVNRIYSALYVKNPDFTTSDILEFLEKNHELKTMNTLYRRN